METGDMFASSRSSEQKAPVQEDLRLEPALEELEEKLKEVIQAAKKVTSALNQWRKAVAVGHVAKMKRSSAAVDEVARLKEMVEAASQWTFDVERYLQEGHWQKEISSLLEERHGLRARIEGSELVSAPVAIRARPTDGVLTVAKKRVPEIRPSFVAEKLASTRQRLLDAKTTELLEALYSAWKVRRHQQSPIIRLKDAYAAFCLAPGWKKENSEAAFAASILALLQSGHHVTRDGHQIQFEFQQGSATKRDLIIVRDLEGRELRFLGVHFT